MIEASAISPVEKLAKLPAEQQQQCQSERENQEFKNKVRKLQIEIDEKNEIISILRDELEDNKDKLDKSEKNNLLLLKDSKRVKYLQDELDFLQDKLSNQEKLEAELKKLKEKLNEFDFLNLRIKELEEDKAKLQEELDTCEERLNRSEEELKKKSVANSNFELELNKWKTFGQELESERDSLQTKLLESINQEEKLNLNSKQVEDEVKRLRLIIKSLEEKHDEEQASNSLTHTSLADLKLQQEFSEKSIEYDKLLETNKSIQDELNLNKKLISDLRQDLACEKTLASKLTKQLATFTKQIKSLDKQYFPIHDQTTLSSSAACSDTSALLAEVKDSEQNLPLSTTLNDDDAAAATGGHCETKSAQEQHQRKSNQSTLVKNEIAATNNLRETTPTHISDSDNSSHRKTVPENSVIRTNGANESSPVLSANGNRSQPEEELKGDAAEVKQDGPGEKPEEEAKTNDDLFSPTSAVDPIDSLAESKPRSDRHPDEEAKTEVKSLSKPPSKSVANDDNNNVDKASDDLNNNMNEKSNNKSADLTKTPVKSSFVRNSLPSRSINYGNLKSSSAYLDRIRASVTATTTTNTTSASSFISEQQQHQQTGRALKLVNNGMQPAAVAPYNQSMLNCMLNHQHNERCFMINNDNNNEQLNLSTSNNSFNGLPMVQPSRQLNALIDPTISNDRSMMMMNMLPGKNQQQRLLQQQQHENGTALQMQQPPNHLHHHHHHHPYVPFDGAELTEQQIAHLASLHHQHYYHHLQHMHQLHKLHHHHQQHHLHLQQQLQKQHQPAGSSPHQSAAKAKVQSPASRASKPEASTNIYSGGSQFYAPAASALLDQVYANMKTSSNQQQVPPRNEKYLVNGSNEETMKPPPQQQYSTVSRETRSSPQKSCHMTGQQQQFAAGHYSCLPQIDEINRVPSSSAINGKQPTTSPLTNNNNQHDRNHYHRLSSPTKQQQQAHRSAQVVMTSDAILKGQGGSNNSNSSSTSSSPTSSASSNLSAGSSSAGSSFNSTSGLPLARNMPLRHTTTELNRQRRQFSIERDLIEPAPMTATLSRVGSCRAGTVTSSPASTATVGGTGRGAATVLGGGLFKGQQAYRHQQQQQSPLNSNGNGPQMLTPVKTQQPPMKTSKILNIAGQANGSQSLHSSPAGPANGFNRRLSTDERMLSSNLADIKLNDSLAFASLRASKQHAADGSNLINRSVQEPSSAGKKAASTDKNRQKSSVWFEYGCV